MTFCSEEQKESEIIQKVEYSNNFYTLYYLDGSEVSYFNSDPEYLKKIEEKVLKQASERNKIDCSIMNVDKWGSLLLSLSTINVTNACLRKNMLTLACIGFIVTLYFISKWRKNTKRLKELKKYKILLENYADFKNNYDISKLVEAEALYREPVNIFTIDNFTLIDMKIMEKSLKK